MDSLMGMSDSMDMSSSGSFRGINSALARDYWYIIAGVVGFMILLRAIESVQSRSRLRRCRVRSIQYPTKIQSIAPQLFATSTAIAREISYPQLFFKNKLISWMSPPSLGKTIVLLCYWAMVAGMMTSGAVVHDAYYWERVAYRSAWIGVTQVPLVYLLASKSSLIGFLMGISHERLNWLHRWVSRTLLLTVTVHGSFFFAEWIRADFVAMELHMMKMVKYGIGCWSILVWTTITSLSPLRRMAYEVFVLQHMAAGAIFLWILYLHVPKYAQYNIWFAVAASGFDGAVRLGLLILSNIRTGKNRRRCLQLLGYKAELEADGEITVITIRDVKISWRPGQHIYLQMPKLGPFESHPYTIASFCRETSDEHAENVIQLAVRVHAGFSRRLHRHAQKHPGSTTTAFITGPFGFPPPFNAFETLVLISASTGASFTLPILESILYNSRESCVTRIHFLLAARDRNQIQFYVNRLSTVFEAAEARGINLRMEIAITGKGYETLSSNATSASLHDRGDLLDADEKPVPQNDTIFPGLGQKEANGIAYSHGRPNIADFIRYPVEDTGGETAVAVCGGRSLVASVRNFVAVLSNERAVHKGTDAQGIFLHVEDFSF